jgi:hypothetical protein
MCRRVFSAIDAGDQDAAQKLAAMLPKWEDEAAVAALDAVASGAAGEPSSRSRLAQSMDPGGSPNMLLSPVHARALLALGQSGALGEEEQQVDAVAAAVAAAQQALRDICISSADSREEAETGHGAALAALSASLAAVKERQRRLRKQLALACTEGISAASPLVTAIFTSEMLAQGLDARLQEASAVAGLRDKAARRVLDFLPATGLDGASVAMEEILSSGEGSSLGPGCKAVDVAPALLAECAVRLAMTCAATPLPEHALLLLSIASGARSSGNIELAARLLDRVTPEQDGAAHEADSGLGKHGNDVMLQRNLERWLLRRASSAVNEGDLDAMQKLLDMLQQGKEQSLGKGSSDFLIAIRISSEMVLCSCTMLHFIFDCSPPF